MRPSSNLLPGTFYGADIEPGTFHSHSSDAECTKRGPSADAIPSPSEGAVSPYHGRSCGTCLGDAIERAAARRELAASPTACVGPLAEDPRQTVVD